MSFTAIILWLVSSSDTVLKLSCYIHVTSSYFRVFLGLKTFGKQLQLLDALTKHQTPYTTMFKQTILKINLILKLMQTTAILIRHDKTTKDFGVYGDQKVRCFHMQKYYDIRDSSVPSQLQTEFIITLSSSRCKKKICLEAFSISDIYLTWSFGIP